MGAGPGHAGTGRAAHGLDPGDVPVAQADDAVGGGGRLLVVGDHDDGLTQALAHAGQGLQQGGGRGGVQRPGGLVGEDNLGAAHEGTGHGHALLLAAGELVGPVGQAVADAQGGDDGVVPVPLRLAVGQALRQEDVLLGAQGGQQVEGLEDEAEAVAAHGGELLVLHAGQVLTSDEHAAGGGGVQARQAVQESGLARAGGAHDGHELAASHHQARRVQGDDPGLALAVDLGQAAGLDDVHRGGSSGRCRRCSRGHRCSLGDRSGIGNVAEGRGLGLSRHLRTLLVWLTRVVGRAGRLIRVASGAALLT